MRAGSKQQSIVVINPTARGNQGMRLWKTISLFVREKFDFQELVTDSGLIWKQTVAQQVKNGVRTFIAAGGDGTVNELLNTIIESKCGVPLEEFTIGAIGLGSSNDFHKPLGTCLQDLAVKLDFSKRQPRDVCRVIYTSETGTSKTRYFTVSGSIGIAAEANLFFNDGDWLLRRFKKSHSHAAIAYAALRTIFRYRNTVATIRIDGKKLETKVTSLSLLKTPYLSGSFRFDTPASPENGKLTVNLCEGLNLPRTLGLLLDLRSGRYLGKPGRWHWMSSNVEIETKKPVALEMDGEIVTSTSARVDIFSERIFECR